MKKLFIFLYALFMSLTYSNAQNTSPYWSLAGNSNATSSSKLGTTNAIDLRIFTNNLERIRVNTSGLVGINSTTPSARLHVNSSSGQTSLRAQVNGSTKFLVSSNGGVSVGSSSTGPANGLYVSGNLGIGTTAPNAKLQVVGSTTAGIGVNTTGYSYGLQAAATYTYGYGVYGSSPYLGVYGSAGNGSYGTYGYSNYIGAYGAGSIYGTYGYSYSGGTAGAYGYGSNGYGVQGESTDSYGGYFTSTNSYALVASTTNAYYAGVFYGHVYASLGYVTSDKNLKKDVQEFSDAISIINKLKPGNYLFKDDAKYASLHLPKGRHYGLLAQDLEQVLPNLVSEAPHVLIIESKPSVVVKPTADGAPQPIAAETKETKETKETINIKAVNYVELIPIVVKAMQEQDVKMKEQDAEIANLKSEINDLKALILKNADGSTATSLSGYLKQNNPNPLNNNTVIKYFIPNDTRNAQILVTDIKGSVLKTYKVTTGEGQLIIRKGELASGTYNYTLYVNNSKIDTKQMIIAR